jgi:glycosyl hydrolase family 42 (putative beta-galactosidase)
MSWASNGFRIAARGVRLCAAWFVLRACCGQGEWVLFEAGRSNALPSLVEQDATARLVQDKGGPVLELATGNHQTWPGITLSAPAHGWDVSAYATIEVRVVNRSEAGKPPAALHCRVDNAGADGKDHCVTGSLKLSPGGDGTLVVNLKRASEDTLDGKLFGMRGYPVRADGPGTIDPAKVTQVLLFVDHPSEPLRFVIRQIRAVEPYHPPTAWVTDATPYFPCIDTFGQYRHKDWPGKVHSLSDLASRYQAETKELTTLPRPKSWDKFGGWAEGPKLEATGFFRTQKLEGKWWLVDPEGRLFFSQGIDCVRAFDATAVEERENWFADFPGKQPEFAAWLRPARADKGHYAGQSPQSFSFSGANVQRKYGAGWAEAFPKRVHQRLRSWGINTIGNWSDRGTVELRLTPYTDSISSHQTRNIEGSEGYWGKFPDVFDASFDQSLRQSMSGKRDRSAGDPMCVGYFSDNEMSWGDERSLGLAALKSPADQPAKQQFCADLKKKYNRIAALNRAWGTDYRSWPALLEDRKGPPAERATADLEAFYTRTAEHYFRQVRDAIKAVAPHQLYLGCRFAWVNRLAAAAASKYCDVVSYNLYRRSVSDFTFNGQADVPLIIGEFHFGALDRGLFHTGLVPTASQEARAKAYADYVTGAIQHPQFVGCHWFQYQDEPTTGRIYDEENYQIGFVDVADTPYPELVEASRDLAGKLYPLRWHTEPPKNGNERQ